MNSIAEMRGWAGCCGAHSSNTATSGAARVRGTRPFAKNAKERRTHWVGDASEIKRLGRPPSQKGFQHCNVRPPELTIPLRTMCGWIPSQAGMSGSNEVKMFARKVAARLKPNTLPEFIEVMETKILPWLRRQEGFLDLIVLTMHGTDEVATISFWDHQSDAGAWAASSFAEAIESLNKLLDGAPYVKIFDVVSSTLHELEPMVEAGVESLARPRESIH